MTSFRHVLDSNISIKLLSAKTPPAVREAMRPRLEQASGLLCISSIMLPASTARANVASGAISTTPRQMPAALRRGM